MFSGPCVSFHDDRFDYGEERLITLGWPEDWSRINRILRVVMESQPPRSA